MGLPECRDSSQTLGSIPMFRDYAEERENKDMPKRILSIKQVLERVPISRQTLYSWVAQGEFPKQIQISGNRVGWDEQEVDEFIQGLIDNRDNS